MALPRQIETIECRVHLIGIRRRYFTVGRDRPLMPLFSRLTESV